MKNRLYFKLNPDSNYLYNRIMQEREYIGYYSLPNQNIEHILDFINNFDTLVERVYIIGIGGSSLGAEAIYSFLRPKGRELIFLDTTDPIYLDEILSNIDFNKSHFFIISKSGSTVETISIFKYLYSLNQNSNRYTFITDKNSKLDAFAKSINSKVFYIPDSVGGRFSVLSAVGLAPLGVCGVDIKALLYGAREIYTDFFERGDIFKTLVEKANFYFNNRDEIPINIIFAYSNRLEIFEKWYIQLWAESLGKDFRGFTPIGLIGSKDQHSFLQLIVEGKRDKSVTFINIKNINSDLKIPDIELSYLEETNILNGVYFKDLIAMQSNSIKESLLNRGIPIDEIVLNDIDEVSIGKLIFYYQLLTSLVGILLDINTYNQNGVEEGKRILKDKLRNLK